MFVLPQFITSVLLFVILTSSSILNAEGFVEVGKTAIPAVVSIQVKSKASAQNNGFYEYTTPFDGMHEDFFGRFFGLPRKVPDQEKLSISQASGFIVSKDGYILTNNHVVKSHGSITVKLNDGREFAGKIIGEDDSTDLALIKIEADNLPFLTLGNSDNLEVGEWVVAIGNPLGLQASLTVGVVSAKGRSDLDITKVEDFIQTDAAINQGNSGGPLLNLKAEVVGINTAIATNYASLGYMGIGFAIPSTMAKHVMDDLIASGSVSRGYIGVLLQPIDANLAEAFGLKKVEGALIAEVVKESPAEKAGLKQGDIILKMNNLPIESMGAFRNFIALQKPGTEVSLAILRNKAAQTVTVTVAAVNPQTAAGPIEKITNVLGFNVDSLTPELAKSLNLSETQGVIVVKVDPNSPAALVGIKRGTVIVSVNNQPVKNKQEFEQEIGRTPQGKPYLFLVKQGDKSLYVSLRVEH